MSNVPEVIERVLNVFANKFPTESVVTISHLDNTNRSSAPAVNYSCYDFSNSESRCVWTRDDGKGEYPTFATSELGKYPPGVTEGTVLVPMNAEGNDHWIVRVVDGRAIGHVESSGQIILYPKVPCEVTLIPNLLNSNWIVSTATGQILGHTLVDGAQVIYPKLDSRLKELGEKAETGIPGLYLVNYDSSRQDLGGPWIADQDGTVIGHFDANYRPILLPNFTAPVDETLLCDMSDARPGPLKNTYSIPKNPRTSRDGYWVLDSTGRVLGHSDSPNHVVLYPRVTSYTPSAIPGIHYVPLDFSDSTKGGPWLVDDDGFVIGHFGPGGKIIWLPDFSASNLTTLEMPFMTNADGTRTRISPDCITSVPKDPSNPQGPQWITHISEGQVLGVADARTFGFFPSWPTQPTDNVEPGPWNSTVLVQKAKHQPEDFWIVNSSGDVIGEKSSQDVTMFPRFFSDRATEHFTKLGPLVTTNINFQPHVSQMIRNTSLKSTSRPHCEPILQSPEHYGSTIRSGTTVNQSQTSSVAQNNLSQTHTMNYASHPIHSSTQDIVSSTVGPPNSSGREPVVQNYLSEYRSAHNAPSFEVDEHTTVVEVPVVEEVLVERVVKKIVEREKIVKKPQINYVDRVVEVPQIQYIEKYVDGPEQIVWTEKYEVDHKVIEVPREVERIVVKPVVEFVEEIVHKPYSVFRNVQQQITIDTNIPVFQDTEVPIVVAQSLRSNFQETSQEFEFNLKSYEPVLIPTEVFIPVAVDFKSLFRLDLRTSHSTVDVPSAHWNSLVKEANPGVRNEEYLPLVRNTLTSAIPTLPAFEKVEIIQPVSPEWRNNHISGTLHVSLGANEVITDSSVAIVKAKQEAEIKIARHRQSFFGEHQENLMTRYQHDLLSGQISNRAGESTNLGDQFRPNPFSSNLLMTKHLNGWEKVQQNSLQTHKFSTGSQTSGQLNSGSGMPANIYSGLNQVPNRNQLERSYRNEHVGSTLNCLSQNIGRFGFSHEVQSGSNSGHAITRPLSSITLASLVPGGAMTLQDDQPTEGN